jgi:hypothetical protein
MVKIGPERQRRSVRIRGQIAVTDMKYALLSRVAR